MTENELIELINKIIILKCESVDIELKSAKCGCPESL